MSITKSGRRIALLGTGIMGGHMARRLAEAGFAVTVWNRTVSKTADLMALGVRIAPHPSTACEGADVVLVMLSNGPVVEQVLFSDDGTGRKPAEVMSAGSVLLVMSSIPVAFCQSQAARLAEKGVHYGDAPVSGGEPGAQNATLSIMVGGSEDDFASAKPILETVGKTIVHVGPNGAGQTVKAANQLIVAGNIELLAEAITFLQAYGVDIDAAVKVLGGGLAGSAVLDQKAQKMLDRNFDPGFRIALHHKDLGIVTAAAREAGVVIPLGAVVAQLMASAMANGDSGLDHSGLLLGVERLSGIDKGQAK
jgi:2-hydroxy-3-oxopropionate reductase